MTEGSLYMAWLRPENRRLVFVLIVLQALLIALPFTLHDMLAVMLVIGLLSVMALLGSTTLAVLYLCLVSAVVPTWFYDDYLTLPLDFKFYEGLFLVVIGLAALTWLLEGRLDWRQRTRLDRPMLALLGMLVFSMGVGLYYGQSVSQMLRDVRYPFYYALFFVVTWFFDTRRTPTFLAIIVAASSVVGVEYLIEFFSQVNLSVSGTFFRVARLEGVMLPIGVLSVSAMLLYDPKIHRRFFAVLAIVPVGLALVLTMGRGMWISLFVGLFALGGLTVLDPHMSGGRRKRLVLLLVIPLLLFVLGYVFQKQTRTGIGETALRRVTRVTGGDVEQDHSLAGRLISYRIALDQIRRTPVLGGGHGATVTFLATDLLSPTVITVGGVDNVYLTIGLRMGVVGVGVFMWVYIAGLWRAFQLFRRATDNRVRTLCAAFIAAYCAMLVYGMADATLFVNRLIFIHATFLGIVARLDATEDREGVIAETA